MMTSREEAIIHFREHTAWVNVMEKAGYKIEAVTAGSSYMGDNPHIIQTVIEFHTDHHVMSTFEGIPKNITGSLLIYDQLLSDFKHAPEVIQGNLVLHGNMFRSLRDIHKHVHTMRGFLSLVGNKIDSHVLGLLLIDGLTKVILQNTQVEDILNRRLGKGRIGMLQAQEELIEAGLEEFAQL
jgi:hypothetical protein